MKPSVSTILRVKNWDSHFENNRTRGMKRMAWIPVPNKHDGDGYTILIDHESGAAHLGVWLVILQVASKCEPRGTLLRNSGKPHDSGSIERLTRIPSQLIDAAIPRLCSEEIGWLEVIDSNGKPQIPQEGAETPQGGAENPQEGIPLGKEGTEGTEYTAKQSGDVIAEQSSFWTSKRNRKLQGEDLEQFKLFWDAFDYKKGRADAIDAFLDIHDLSDATIELICAKAKAEALNRQSLTNAGSIPKMAQGWLSSRRWEDEVVDAKPQPETDPLDGYASHKA